MVGREGGGGGGGGGGGMNVAALATVIGPLLIKLLGVAIVIFGVFQAAGIGLFFYTMWQRIRPAGSQTREAQGERF